MDKRTAANTITNAGMTTRDIAHSIYLATVEGISGANQNDGYGFALSAIAELWNIRGDIGKPNARTKITSRYRGKNITEGMIYNAVASYPNGIQGQSPLFDDLVGVGSNIVRNNNSNNMKSNNNVQVSEEDSFAEAMVVLFVVLFIVAKLFLGWGWILSLIASFGLTTFIAKKLF